MLQGITNILIFNIDNYYVAKQKQQIHGSFLFLL